MSRRARGEGTIYRDGSRWVARVDLPPGADGKRRQRKRRTRTKAEAVQALRFMTSELESVINPDGESRTVAQAADEWFRIQPKDKQQSTIDNWAWRCDVIRTGLGARTLGQLTVADCDMFLDCAARGEFGSRTLSPDSVRRLRSVLINVIRNEARLGNIVRNVADLSVMPQAAGASTEHAPDGDSSLSSRRSLDHDEFRRLWRAARYPLLVAVELIGRNGLRPAEARGLRWSRVDLETGTLTVDTQMTSGTILADAKTKRSRRTIPIDGRTIETLTSWAEQQDVKRGRAGDRWHDLDLVISTRYGTGINGPNLQRMVEAACSEAGIDRYLPYELRHTAITFQIEAGQEAWKVADWAGTSVRMIEDVYRHRLSRVTEISSARVPDLDL